MHNLFKKFIREDTSIVIISIFILILPLIINIHISDMVLSIRYLSLSVLVFLLYMLRFKNGINTNIFKNPIIISLLILFFINILSSAHHNLTADAWFTLYRLFVFLSLTVFFANLFEKADYLLIAKSILCFLNRFVLKIEKSMTELFCVLILRAHRPCSVLDFSNKKKHVCFCIPKIA